MEEVIVTIAKDGSVSIQTTGFTGMACTSATAGLEGLLGEEVLERNMTDEAFRTQQTVNGIDLGQSW